jgi:uncharacterized protein (DUF1697 family)
MKFVALLRGINVGGNCKVEMKKLKSVFELLGATQVITYINSGNVVFEFSDNDQEKLTSKIENILSTEFGFKIPTLLRTGEKIQTLVQEIPKQWTNDESQRTDILFLWQDYDNKKSMDLINAKAGIDHLLYLPGAIAWNIDRKFYAKSSMHKFIGTKLYKNMTARNVNTVRKLAQLLVENKINA